ncbi:hypothetical protein CEP54_013061 [Fusarium duplospermum]|uniref:Uncharacterized protein n=1 Tax=Fusarium duplospermum TaxID=1325734 RepID=A0A428P550_9HYPO|nr:hypothetical protein CEP54_013061 [Fusarium duplospermum]
MAPKRRLSSDDDAGGLPLRKRRITELLAALSDRGETNGSKVNHADLVEHHEPQANGTVNSSRHKRPAPDMEESSLPERNAKRPALNTTHGKSAEYESRLKIYQMLHECTHWDAFCYILNTAHELGDMTLALTLHDSPSAMRLKALKQLRPEWRKRLIELVTDIEHEKELFDPRSLFPTVVTDSFLDFLSISNANMRGKAIVCVICERGFCGKNVEGAIDIEEVIWKDCGTHLMHAKCYRSKVLEGDMPHVGPCPCVPASDLT